MLGKRLIKAKVAVGGGGCTDIVDNYDPFGGGGLALYQLNGDATDVSGNYNGTASNVTYGTGVFGQAGVFNGSSSYIDTALNSSAVSSSSDFTISAWVNIDNFTSSYSQILVDGSNASWAGLGFSFQVTDTGTLRLNLANNGSSAGVTLTSSAVLQTGNWSNVVAVIDIGNKISLYLNGENVANSSISSGARNTIGNWQIGRDTSGARWFDGSIDQVRIFNEALDPLEIEALYTEELCICDGTVDTLDILGDGSCIATYQLDGNANDLSGNYSGTPTDVSYGVGEFDLAGVFNGSSSRIESNIDVFNTTTYSVSLWANVGSYKGASYNHWAFIINNDQHVVIGESPANTLKIYFSDFTISNPFYTITDPTAWHHIVVTRTGNSISMYVNGTLANTFSYGGLSQGTGFKLGTNHTDNAFFDGSIDQVRIFNKALSSSEVTTLYNETACTVTYSNTEWRGAWDTVNSITSACAAGSSTLSFSNNDRTATESGTGFYVGAFSENQYGTFYLFGADAGGLATKFTGNFTDDTFIYRPILEGGVYAEILMEAPELRLGITKNRVCTAPDQSAWYDNAIVYRNWTGQIIRYNTVVTTTATFTVGDIIGILLDETAGIVTFYKNGTFVYTVSL